MLANIHYTSGSAFLWRRAGNEHVVARDVVDRLNCPSHRRTVQNQMGLLCIFLMKKARSHYASVLPIVWELAGSGASSARRSSVVFDVRLDRDYPSSAFERYFGACNFAPTRKSIALRCDRLT